MSHPTFDQLKSHLATITDLRMAGAVLGWDQETYMPAGSAGARANQMATLERLAHEYLSENKVGEWLKILENQNLSDDEAAIVKITRQDYDQAVKVPADLVEEMALAVAMAKQAWKKARSEDDFASYVPHLQKVVDLNRQKAEVLGYEDEPYDALLNQYEPGMKTAEVRAIFAELREALVPVVKKLAESEGPNNDFLCRRYDEQKQWDFGMKVLADFGYDFNRGRQDLSAHPFTTNFSINDVRITTRVIEDWFPSALFGTLHECGHGMYEQGIDQKFDRTPVAAGTSLGMHESQSRLWENQVGRSLNFWKHYFDDLKTTFPDVLADINLDQFYRGINQVSSSLIRVEADEVTYNLHIMLRFELELAMINGDVEIKDLPELWNSKMEEYLGIKPDSDADGVLQDIHWSLGAIGYFPTYSLGNLMSAQIWDQIGLDIENRDQLVAKGQFGDILSWLQTNIHQFGRSKSAGEILKDATGQTLGIDAWMNYIKEKYGAVYGIEL